MLQIATIADTTLLQQVCREAYTQHFGGHWEEGGLDIYLEAEFNTKRVQEDITNPNKTYFFIKYEGETVGFIKIDVNASHESFPNENCCELEKIYILPGHAGKGVGKKALGELLSFCREKDMNAIFLYVIDTNESAFHYYQKMGFQQDGTGRLEAPLFKEELRGMFRMSLTL
ncbi:MAG: GNAT family N-acetyltransferase [Bacteroidota bacterium]